MLETYFVIAFFGVLIVFLTRSKIGAVILGIFIVFLIISSIIQFQKDQADEAAREGKVQIYHNGKFEWVTPERRNAIYKQESEDHYRKWAAEHPEEARKDRIRDSISRKNNGYGIRSIYDPK